MKSAYYEYSNIPRCGVLGSIKTNKIPKFEQLAHNEKWLIGKQKTSPGDQGWKTSMNH